jgi:hypothetical protein
MRAAIESAWSAYKLSSLSEDHTINSLRVQQACYVYNKLAPKTLL